MTIAKLGVAMAEAQRFMNRATALLDMQVERQQDKNDPIWSCPEQAATRRASLDLTKALAALRRSDY